MSAKYLKSLSEAEIFEFLNSFDTVLSDCDGVLWQNVTPLPGAADVLNTFRELGKKVFYVTNNSTKTRAELAKKCEDLKFKASEGEVVCTANMVAQYLKDLNFKKKVYVIGSEGISKELTMAGIAHSGIGPDVTRKEVPYFDIELEENIGAVIVGFDDHFSYPKLLKATTYLNDENVLFIATNTDERFPISNSKKVVPGTGSLVRSVETAAERKAFVIGKPSTYTAEMLKIHYNVNSDRTLMIGDRANTDILLGTRCGFKTLLVLSGVSSTKDIDRWRSSDSSEDKQLLPDIYTDSIADLLPYLKKLQKQ